MDENNPKEHGWKTATWDCVEIQKYLDNKYGIELSQETIRKLLKRNGFNYKKAEYLFSKRDLEKRNNFMVELFALYESLVNTKIMFCDEMSAKLHPKLGYVWTRSDKVYVETNCSHKRINTIAVIEPIIGEKVSANCDKNNADSFVQFLEKLGEDVQTCFDSIGPEQIKKICNLEIIRKHLVTELGGYKYDWS